PCSPYFYFNATATPEIYTLSLHDALPIYFNMMEDYNKDPDLLNKFGRNIVEAVKQGKIDPVIGREDEIRRIIKILSRKTKNSPRSEEHTSELQSRENLVCRLLLEKKKKHK